MASPPPTQARARWSAPTISPSYDRHSSHGNRSVARKDDDDVITEHAGGGELTRCTCAARWKALLLCSAAAAVPNTRLHRAPISPAAGRTCPALHCCTDMRRASAGAISIAENEVRPAACALFLPKHPCCAPHPKAAAGALVVTFATAARLARFHIPTPYQPQLVAASARFWRKIGAPRAVRSHPVNCIHPEAGITSHGWEPVRDFDDLPHWRGVICFPNDQCRSLPRGATFEAIPGEGHQILVPPDSQVWRQWQLPN